MNRRIVRGVLAVTAVAIGGVIVTLAVLNQGPSGPTPSPSTPAPFASGTLVLRLAETRGIGPYRLTLSLYSDGRVLTPGGNRTGSLLQRRLSPNGMRLLTDAVASTGFFKQSHDVPTIANTGSTPPLIEGGLDRFILMQQGARVQVTTASDEPAWMAHSDERVTLNRLATRLEDLSWVPADDWTDAAPGLYDGGRWLLWAGAINPDLGSPRPPDVRDAWLPIIGTDPRRFGTPFTSADGVIAADNRCGVVTSQTMHRFLDPLVSEGFVPAGAWFGQIDVPWSGQHSDLSIEWRVVLPEEAPSCAGKAYPPAVLP